MAQTNPLVRVLGLTELLEAEAETPPPVRDIADEQTVPLLVQHVRAAWTRNKQAKEHIEAKMLYDLRARRGQFSPTDIERAQREGGLHLVWHDLTETKCRAASALIRDVVLPAGDRPWGIEPTPIPDLPDEIKRSIVNRALEQATQTMAQIAEAGGGVISKEEYRRLVAEIGESLREEAERTYRKTAAKRAARMEAQIEDRLKQGGWEAAMDAFIEDFVTYPAAILKGPIYRVQRKLEWGDGWQPRVAARPVQTWARVSPFDVYPAPGSASPHVGDFIERVRFHRQELYDLRDLPGYQSEQIDRALMDYSAGHLEGWLWTETERQRLEQETHYLFLSPPGVIDALSYWGSVPGWMLIQWGVEGIDDPTRDYECNVLLCGQYVLYAALNPNPLGLRPYHRACYDEIPGAFWGRSIPELCRTPQRMCNAIASAYADNLGAASGPMTWVHVDRLADGEQSLDIFPWKVWQLKSDPTQGVNPGVGFFQAEDRSQSLMMALERWELRADDTTGIPRYTYGNERVGGAGNTASGLSMLMSNAAKGLRRAIGNIDRDVTVPTIYQCFVNEMLYNPDQSIKGDCVVVPRGAAAILIKEAAQDRRMTFLQMTANPIDMAIIGEKGRAAILRETAAAMELPVDEVVPTAEELDQRARQQAEQQQAAMQQQQAMEQQRMQQQLALKQAEAEASVRADERKQLLALIGDAVRDAMREQQQRRRLRFEYDDAGMIRGGEVVE